jgi:hypothetical protein
MWLRVVIAERENGVRDRSNQGLAFVGQIPEAICSVTTLPQRVRLKEIPPPVREAGALWRVGRWYASQIVCVSQRTPVACCALLL